MLHALLVEDPPLGNIAVAIIETKFCPGEVSQEMAHVTQRLNVRAEVGKP